MCGRVNSLRTRASGISCPTLSELNRVELDALERLIRRADGFRLALAVVNHPSLRDRLAAELREDLLDCRLTEVTLEPHNGDGVVRALERAATDDPGAVLVTGLGAPGEVSPDLGELNLNRDYLRRAVACPVVFWLPDLALRAFVDSAADL